MNLQMENSCQCLEPAKVQMNDPDIPAGIIADAAKEANTDAQCKCTEALEALEQATIPSRSEH